MRLSVPCEAGGGKIWGTQCEHVRLQQQLLQMTSQLEAFEANEPVGQLKLVPHGEDRWRPHQHVTCFGHVSANQDGCDFER